MAVRKVAKKSTKNTAEAELRIVALAEQLGWFLGTVRGTADGLLANETMRREMGRVRDRAAELLEQANRATAPVQKRVAAAGATAQKKVVEVGAKAKNAVATASDAARRAVKGTPVVVTVAKKSRGAVDAPGKRHRKPPPQEKVNPRASASAAKQMGKQAFQPGHGARRG